MPPWSVSSFLSTNTHDVNAKAPSWYCKHALTKTAHDGIVALRNAFHRHKGSGVTATLFGVICVCVEICLGVAVCGLLYGCLKFLYVSLLSAYTSFYLLFSACLHYVVFSHHMCAGILSSSLSPLLSSPLLYSSPLVSSPLSKPSGLKNSYYGKHTHPQPHTHQSSSFHLESQC